MLIASLVCAHLESKHPGITLKEMDDRLSYEVFKHYKKWCQQKGPSVSACSHRFSTLRFGKDKWASYPELGSVYKAAVVKTMMYWCADFLKQEDMEIPDGELRVHTMHAFAAFQSVIDNNGPFFDPETTEQVVKYGHTGLLLYQKLAGMDRTRPDGRCTYKLIPKFHSVLELLIYIEETNRNPRQLYQYILDDFDVCICFSLLSRSMNPTTFFSIQISAFVRFEHCYQDEDLMQQVGRIASRTHPATLERVTLQRYRALVQLFTQRLDS